MSETYKTSIAQIRIQKRIIEQAINGGSDLENLLSARGLVYEDIRYIKNGHPQTEISRPSTKYKTLVDFSQPYHGIPLVSFFSGCGGLDLGFEVAGYEHRALIENNVTFCKTLRLNRDWPVLGPPKVAGDISKRKSLTHQLNNLGVKEKFPGLFLGGPPCQPFSIAANQRFSKKGKNFKRVGFGHEKNGNLLFDFIYFIKKFKPVAFMIENVPGLIDLDEGKQVEQACVILKKAGYTISDPLKINSAHYSVPQHRERVFIIGSTTGKEFKLPPKNPDTIPCVYALDGINRDCPNHITRKHKAVSIKRYSVLDYGKRDHLGRVDRLDPSLPSKTVIAGGTAGGGRSHLHPYIPRTLSVRECARLQTFPDDYVFEGSYARQFTQVGNAVPPVLAAQLAAAIYHSYF